MGLIQTLLETLRLEGYDKPTPLQKRAVPVLLEGSDVFGIAGDETGKTTTFILPIIQSFISCKLSTSEPVQIRALILTHSQEKAIEIDQKIESLGKAFNIKHLPIYQGDRSSQRDQERKIMEGIHVLTATPDRLVQLVEKKYVDLSRVSYLVLDDANNMILNQLQEYVNEIISSLPSSRQNVLFTKDAYAEIVTLSTELLRDPVAVHDSEAEVIIKPIKPRVFHLKNPTQKFQLFKHLVVNEKIKRALVFVEQKDTAIQLVKRMKQQKISAPCIYADGTESIRKKALSAFKQEKNIILVLTTSVNLAEDIGFAPHVINYDLPAEPEEFAHRLSHAGRGGKSGVLTVLCGSQERGHLRDIEDLIGYELPVHDFTLRKSVSPPTKRPVIILPKTPSVKNGNSKIPPVKKGISKIPPVKNEISKIPLFNVSSNKRRTGGGIITF